MRNLSPTSVQSFWNELEKIAYGPKGHVHFANVVGQAAGASPAAQEAITRSALKTDEGVRHPNYPWTDPMHSFGGSQTQQQIGKNVVKSRDAAVRDLAASVAKRDTIYDRLVSGARMHRGRGYLGQAAHQLPDITAHNEKPIAAGVALTEQRKAAPKVGYGGGFTSSQEHLASKGGGFKTWLRSKLPGGEDLEKDKGYLDTLGKSPEDMRAASRAKHFGARTRSALEKELVSTHGLSPEAAAQAAHKALTDSPSLASRVLGEASRDSRYIKGEVSRARAAGLPAARAVGGFVASSMAKDLAASPLVKKLLSRA